MSLPSKNPPFRAAEMSTQPGWVECLRGEFQFALEDRIDALEARMRVIESACESALSWEGDSHLDTLLEEYEQISGEVRDLRAYLRKRCEGPRGMYQWIALPRGLWPFRVVAKHFKVMPRWQTR